MVRRRSHFRRLLFLAGALGLLAATLWLGSQTWSTKDSMKILQAAELIDGSGPSGAKSPAAAIDMLERVVERSPGNYAAYFELGNAWAALGAYDNAVAELKQAANVTTDVKEAVRAKRLARVYLQKAERYDEAVEMAQEMAELEPESALHRLGIGLAMYDASLAKQRDLLQEYVSSALAAGVDDLTDRVESYVTDLWSDPDVEVLVQMVLLDGDVVAKRDLRSRLLDTRKNYVEAVSILDEYRYYPGADIAVSRAYVEMLFRSGRIYESHIEAGMALQEPGLNGPQRRKYLEMQAKCSEAIGSWSEAGDRYEMLIEGLAEGNQPVPDVYLHSLYEVRVRAEQWDWIRAHADEHARVFGDDVMMRYAVARALEIDGQLMAALQAIEEHVSTLTMGRTSKTYTSLRRNPERRRELLLTVERLLAAAGDPRRTQALDALIRDFPEDPVVRRLRMEVNLADNRTEAALEDAQALLHLPVRNSDDFDHWFEIADDLSRKRRGRGLTELAADIAEDAEAWRDKHGDALWQKQQAGSMPSRTAFAEIPIQLFWPQDPALSFAIVEELIDRGDLESARSALRRLSSAFPRIHEFRYRLADLLVRDGMLDSAANEYRELVKALPGDTEVLDLAMRTEIALGRHLEASRLLTRMILDDPLGVGATHYGLSLVRQGRPAMAEKLIKRLQRWEGLEGRLDVVIVGARAAIALGRFDEARKILDSLASQSHSVSVASLAFDLGLATGDHKLVGDAAHFLKPLASSLFPDQMPSVAERFLEAGLYDELLDTFDESIRVQPSARPALRSIIRACTATGRMDEADDLLQLLDDDYAALDRFLLLALAGQGDEAGRRLRLEIVPPEMRDTIDICQMVRSAMMRRTSILDLTPVKRLSALQLNGLIDERGLELMDALLRLAPSTRRLGDVRPREVVSDPAKLYRAAGADVMVLVQLCKDEPAKAEQVIDLLALLLLTGDRPFWAREAGYLAEQVALLAPDLPLATHVVARRRIEQGRPDEALLLLRPLLAAAQREEVPTDLRTIELLLRASRDSGRPEWGVAVCLEMVDRPDVRLALADALREWGHAAESIEYYESFLAHSPHDPRALKGIIAALGTEDHQRRIEIYVRQALQVRPDPDVIDVAAMALFSQAGLLDSTLLLIEELHALVPDQLELIELMGRAYADKGRVEDVETVLSELVRIVDGSSQLTQNEAGRRVASVLVHAAGVARQQGLNTLARDLNERVLRIDPGAIPRYKEIAYLELEEGRLDIARRYFEVLTFINLSDKEAAKTLAQLYANRLGRPIEAANVVRRSFPGSPPPWAVAILAAESYLLGDPNEAFQAFARVSSSPLIGDDEYYTLGRIAYASGMLDTAYKLFNTITFSGDRDHPDRLRAHWILKRRLEPPAEPEPSPEEEAVMAQEGETGDAADDDDA